MYNVLISSVSDVQADISRQRISTISLDLHRGMPSSLSGCHMQKAYLQIQIVKMLQQSEVHSANLTDHIVLEEDGLSTEEKA